MDMKKFLFAAVGACVFVFLYEFLMHGVLLANQYQQTMAVWRPQAEANMTIMLLSQVMYGVAVAFFYPIVGPDTDCKKAIPFGVGLGLVMAAPQIATYVYLPIPLTLSLLWAVIAFVKALGSAFIVSKIYNWKS